MQRKVVLTGLPDNKKRTIMETSVYLDDFESEDGDGVPRKRKRLTHLSPEEKMMRRKLKNRVAAQTARDRKKALMSDLERQVAQLMEENKRLHRENSHLKNKSTELVKENSQLKERLGGGTKSSVSGSEYVRSAAPFVPLPKVQTQAQSHLIHPLATSFLTVSLCLALCSKNSNSRKETKLLVKQVTPDLCSSNPPHNCQQSRWWGPQQRNWNPSMN